MRLISQDGKIDVPYENVCVSINYRNKNQIIAWNFGCVDCEIATMATYSTEAESLKVMEMLREQYMKLGMIKILASGTCEYMDKSLEKEEKMGIYADYCRKHCFKFPADEEVEVQDE